MVGFHNELRAPPLDCCAFWSPAFRPGSVYGSAGGHLCGKKKQKNVRLACGWIMLLTGSRVKHRFKRCEVIPLRLPPTPHILKGLWEGSWHSWLQQSVLNFRRVSTHPSTLFMMSVQQTDMINRAGLVPADFWKLGCTNTLSLSLSLSHTHTHTHTHPPCYHNI